MAIPKLCSYSLKNIMDGVENKVSWTINPDNAVLLIHDMQQYFLDFYADTILQKQLIHHIQQIKHACKAAGIPVVYTAQPGDQNPDDRALLTDFWGDGLKDNEQITRIVPELAPEPDDTVLTKWRYSAFKRSKLWDMMRSSQRDQLIIVGVYAHIGCMLTAADAFMYDIQSFFVADGLGDFSREEHQQALHYVSQRCGFVTTQAQVLAAVGGTARPLTLFPRSKTALKTQIAAMIDLDESEIYDDDNLVDLGLDSVRAMSLLAGWQQAGLKASFIDFAHTPSLERWWQLIEPQAS